MKASKPTAQRAAPGLPAKGSQRWLKERGKIMRNAKRAAPSEGEEGVSILVPGPESFWSRVRHAARHFGVTVEMLCQAAVYSELRAKEGRAA